MSSHHIREAVVTGAIGDFEAEIARRMASFVPDARPMAEDGLIVHTDGHLRPWAFGSHRGWTWAKLDCSISPTSVESAREESGAAGVAVRDQSVSLHADHLGVWPVYYARRGEAVYFSNRLDPVLSIIERPMLDRVAWASLMSTRSVPPGRSVVEQVSTLRQGETIRYDQRGRGIIHDLDIPLIQPETTEGLSSLVDAIGDVMAELGEVDLFLSGGLDSRLLLACATTRGARITCLTTDTGDSRDRLLARSAADIAGAEFTDVPTASDWLGAFTEAAARMDYATTMHTWGVGLTRKAIERKRGVAAGMGGGILLNDHLQDRSDDASGSKPAVRTVLARRLGLWALSKEGLVAAPIRAMHDELEADFLEWSDRYSDRPDWQALTILTTRTARAITPLVTRLAGPDVSAAVPYLAPRVMTACLAEGIHRRRGDDLHREIAGTIFPDLADLETPADLPPLEPRPIGQSRRPEALARAVAAIAGDEVAVQSMGPALQAMVVEQDIHQLMRATRRSGEERVLHGALLLSLFRSAHPTVDGDLAD